MFIQIPSSKSQGRQDQGTVLASPSIEGGYVKWKTHVGSLTPKEGTRDFKKQSIHSSNSTRTVKANFMFQQSMPPLTLHEISSPDLGCAQKNTSQNQTG
jgi:hypothetical protein